MNAVLSALAKAFGQIGDRAVVAVLIKCIATTLALFALACAGLYWALAALFRRQEIAAILPEGFAPAAQAFVALVLGLAAFWFLFRVVALAVLQFFADEIVIAVEQRHYPEAALRAKALPFRRDLANSLRGIGRTIAFNLLAFPVAAVLAFTAIGSALVFLAVNAWLLGRELTDMAWLRHCEDQLAQNPVPRGQRLLLGAAVAGIMLVPLANFLAPIIGAAAGTHLSHRAMARRVTEQGTRGRVDA